MLFLQYKLPKLNAIPSKPAKFYCWMLQSTTLFTVEFLKN